MRYIEDRIARHSGSEEPLKREQSSKSAGRMGCHPYDPLTTTNSH
ncbi:hypothetical protein BVI1335_2340022 [Burkholderia vietnamiensis]|nr:hypothetical protein BVI1335_2340022 [Burkholderia vietnamiensis]